MEAAHSISSKQPERQLAIRRELAVNDVAWPQIVDLVKARAKCSHKVASRWVAEFYRCSKRAIELRWYQRGPLSKRENLVASCIAQRYSADIVVLTQISQLRIGGFVLSYYHAIEFQPDFGAAKQSRPGGDAKPQVVIGLGRLEISVETGGKALLVYLVTAAIMIVGYVVVLGLLLYGVAVLVMFWQHPFGMTTAATSHATIGLALLCTLVGGAGILGRLISRLYRSTQSASKRGNTR